MALQGLCCLDVQGPGVRDLVEGFLDDSRERPDTVRAARQMLEGTLAGREECDRLLGRHARNWELARLALVDRNVLRLGCWELLAGRAPVQVVISEAVKLAGEFSTAESPRFVNGVLDAVARALGEEAEPPQYGSSTAQEPPTT